MNIIQLRLAMAAILMTAYVDNAVWIGESQKRRGVRWVLFLVRDLAA